MDWRDVDELRRQLLTVYDLSAFQIVRVCDCGSSAIVFHCRLSRGGVRRGRQLREGGSAIMAAEVSSMRRNREGSGNDDAAACMDVAVKVHFCYSAMAGLPHTGPKADEFARRLVDAEVRALAALPFHPNVVPLLRVLGPCALPPSFYQMMTAEQRALQPPESLTMALVTPFYPFSLENLLRPGGGVTSALSVLDVSKLLRGVMQAVHHCTIHGVMHLDVKEDNVMVTKNGEAVLIDFGSAHVFPMSTPATCAACTEDSDTFDFCVNANDVSGGNSAHMHPGVLRGRVKAAAAAAARNSDPRQLPSMFVDFSPQPAFALCKLFQDVWKKFVDNQQWIIPDDSWEHKSKILAMPDVFDNSAQRGLSSAPAAAAAVQRNTCTMPPPFEMFCGMNDRIPSQNARTVHTCSARCSLHDQVSIFEREWSVWQPRQLRKAARKSGGGGGGGGTFPSAIVFSGDTDQPPLIQPEYRTPRLSGVDALECLGPNTLTSFRDSAGHTVMHAAAELPSDQGVPLVLALLHRNLVDPLARDHDSATALHYAVRANNVAVVRTLLGDVSATGTDSLAVANVAETSVVQKLLHCSSPSACSALVWACTFDSAEACKVLLEHPLPYHITDDNAPCQNNEVEILDDKSITDGTQQYATMDVACINVFLYAAFRGSLKCARLLLEHGADVNCSDHDNVTALLFALSEGDRETASMILNHRQSPIARIDIPENTSNFTALYLACEEGQPADIVEAVIQRWLNDDPPPLLHSGDESGTEPSFNASALLHLDVHGWSPLFAATGSGHLQVVRQLCGAADPPSHKSCTEPQATRLGRISRLRRIVAAWLTIGTTAPRECWGILVPAGTTVFSLIEMCMDQENSGGGSPTEEGGQPANAQPDNDLQCRPIQQTNLLEIQKLLRKTAARLPVLALPYMP